MANRFRLAVAYKFPRDMPIRPPLAPWLDPNRDMTYATPSQKTSYNYWTKIYWATPPWITEDMIQEMTEIYLSANDADHENPEHVDHIVPLKSPIVCGLQVPWNLEVVSDKYNLHKSNDMWPGHPYENKDLFEDIL